jgi:MFS family permease
MEFYRHLFIKNPKAAPITYGLVYLLSILFTFQTLVTAYSSSTFLETFIDRSQVGWLFAFGSCGALVFTLLLPRILNRYGNIKTLLFLSLTIMTSLLLVGLMLSPVVTLIAFVIYLMANPLIYLNIDVFLETLIGDQEGTTGSKRGIILTMGSIAAFFSPLAMGWIIGSDNNLQNVYFVAALVGIPIVALIVGRLRHFYDPSYEAVSVSDMAKSVNGDTDLKIVLFNHFLLQFFFAWAVIYIPLYLADEIGLDWVSISYIISAGLIAFVIIQFPAGWLADKYIGEKEMMAIGFVFLTLAAAGITVMTTSALLAWMILMFISRIGASLVEVTTEIYFFKKISGRQSNLISLFRTLRPLAQLCGAAVASAALFMIESNKIPTGLLEFKHIFLLLAVFMAIGVFLSSRLNDTK